ncbi:MAG TPA: hypothetical protein VGD81_06570 [Opitutaceae bacterium]
MRCPFHDGPETLDGLLAEVPPSESALLDAALDLRHALGRREDAEAALNQLFSLRRLLDGRHYLAFYRLRCWLQRLIVVQARSHRGEAWQTFPLPLNGARLDEVIDSTLARLTAPGCELPGCAHVRFVFATSALNSPAPLSPAALASAS